MPGFRACQAVRASVPGAVPRLAQARPAIGGAAQGACRLPLGSRCRAGHQGDRAGLHARVEQVLREVPVKGEL